jgi:hypothetical protein
MKKTSFRRLALAVILGASLAGTVRVTHAQEEKATPAKQTSGSEEVWYRTAPQAEKQTLARQKAVRRGEERMARMEALKWYGYSNARPVTTGMPFTTMYSPAWQMPGGRPYGWYTSSRPIVIITAAPVYR